MKPLIGACAVVAAAACVASPYGQESDGGASTDGGPEDASLVERDVDVESDAEASDTDAGATKDACAGPTTLLLTGVHYDVDVAASLGSPACAVHVAVVIEPDASVGATSSSVPALWVHGLAAGSTVSIENGGRIIGAGGSGGNGGSGGTPLPCGRPGEGAARRSASTRTFRSRTTARSSVAVAAAVAPRAATLQQAAEAEPGSSPARVAHPPRH